MKQINISKRVCLNIFCRFFSLNSIFVVVTKKHPNNTHAHAVIYYRKRNKTLYKVIFPCELRKKGKFSRNVFLTYTRCRSVHLIQIRTCSKYIFSILELQMCVCMCVSPITFDRQTELLAHTYRMSFHDSVTRRDDEIH